MPRQPVALAISDVSAFARSLEAQMAALGRLPGHEQLMNMLARAGGFANFQHLRGEQTARTRPVLPVAAGSSAAPPAPVPADAPDDGRIGKASHYFDTEGRLASWPSKPSVQTLCLWVLWARIPAAGRYDERSFSAWLNDWHLFGDAAMLRREMWVKGMIHRSPRGTDYHRLDATPPPELAPLLIRLGAAAGA